MAAELEFYFNSTTTPAAHGSSDYATYLTCAANRTGKSGAKNFFIIAHISTGNDNLSCLGKVRLQIGGVDYGECADGLTHSNQRANAHGYTYNFVKRVSLDASSHSITLDCGCVAAQNFYAENASIVVLEESAAAEYADSVDTVGTDGTDPYFALQFSPASTQSYLLIFSCETMCEDESDSGVGGIAFIETDIGPTTYLEENHGELVTPSNDDKYRTVGGACFAELNSANTYNFIIQMDGGGSGDGVFCRKGAIVAIPFGDFENVYTDIQSAKKFHLGTTFSDTDVVMAAQACNEADHLIIAGFEFSNESPAVVGYWRLRSDGVDFTVHQFDDRDEDGNEYYLGFAVHGKTLTSGDKNFEVEGNSSAPAENWEGCGRNGYLAVCEIPTGEAPPPSYIPQLMMIT